MRLGNHYSRERLVIIFNNFFAFVPKQVVSELKTLAGSYTNKFNFQMMQHTLFLKPVTGHDVARYIGKLKNKHSAGDDCISNNLLKKMTSNILEPLTYLINLSFEKGVFPNRFKIARVVPVYKKGNTADCRNYRPVSLF